MFKIIKKISLLLTTTLLCSTSFANDDLFRQARALQRDGKYDEAIEAFKTYLLQDVNKDSGIQQQTQLYPEALMQLMNTFQSDGKPEACISALEQVYTSSPVLQEHYLRDFYSVMGYALSRTERMKEAQETTLKVFTLPLNNPTAERLFRDYAYAACVFYSNPDYQNDVIIWCQEALEQAELCKNTSGKQWVTAMLGAVHKRNGQLNDALKLFLKSKEEAQNRTDDLGVLNSLHALTDLFIHWNVPEYANLYASEAIEVEKRKKIQNPMVSAQSYINKGRTLLQLGITDSVLFYSQKAREFCQSLPYNSGMVDVDLLDGTYHTEKGGDLRHLGIQELKHVTHQGTATNRAKAYHQLAQTYLKYGQDHVAEIMLDSLYTYLNQSESPFYIHIDFEPILDYFLKKGDSKKTEQYVRMLLMEQSILKGKKVNYNLVEAIVNQQTEQERQELKIVRLKETTQHLWLVVCISLSLLIIAVIVGFLVYQRKKLALLDQQLNQSNAQKAIIEREVDEMMNDNEKRQELTSLTPSILKKSGESEFRQRFEVLYPLFLPRLREKIPSITRREELLSMLIVLKQDNKEIAELLAVAPRSVLMLRHRFRQKIGLATDYSLEDFIDNLHNPQK